MLAQMDDGVGRVLAALRENGLEENTLVLFLSDNGGPTRELTSSNAPLRGEKGQLLEGGIRIPFVVSWKDHVPAGREDPRMVSALDLYPTALAAAEAPAVANLDGVNLLPHLAASDNEAFRPRHYWRVGPQAALREGDWKIYRSPAGKAWQLFHLTEDPGEAHDLAAAHPDRVAALEAAWKKLDAEMISPLWGSAGKGSQ